MTVLLSLNKSYTKTASNDTNVNRRDATGLAIIDGVIGPYDFEDSAWVGWQDTNVTIRIDLGLSQTLSSTRFHLISVHSEDTYAPNQVVISGSNDDSSWFTLGTFVKTTNWSNADDFWDWSNNLTVMGSYRYIKYVFTYQVKRLLISEIEIYGTDNTPTWTSPVFDRVLADVIPTPTAKGYFNVADWIRVYNNAYVVNVLAVAYLSTAITFDFIFIPTTATVPTVVDLNKLLHNIERVRATLNLSSTTYVAYSWGEGNVQSPKWSDVNHWEETLSIMYTYLAGILMTRKVRAGVSISGVGLTRSNKWRS